MCSKDIKWWSNTSESFFIKDLSVLFDWEFQEILEDLTQFSQKASSGHSTSVLRVENRNPFLTGLTHSIHKGIKRGWQHESFNKARRVGKDVICALSHTQKLLLCRPSSQLAAMIRCWGSEKTGRHESDNKSERRVQRSSSSIRARATSTCQSIIHMIQLSFTPTHSWLDWLTWTIRWFVEDNENNNGSCGHYS